MGAALVCSAAAQTPGLDSPQAVAPYFNGVFPTTAPGQATGWTTVNAFPGVSLINPIQIQELPGTSRMLVVGKNGQIWSFPNSPAATQAEVTTVLDWSAKTQTGSDMGFYSITFHPRFGQVGQPGQNFVYACYNHRPGLAGQGEDKSYWRLSRFTWLPATGTIDPTSEFVLINLFDPHGWHNGGAAFFGPDGFLHITNGDGGGVNNPFLFSQTITSGLFGGLLRIDVDNDPAKSHAIRRQPLTHSLKPAGWPISYSQGYGIPNDNPWLDAGGGVLEEFFAIGLRSPHTAHYDAATGDIWVGDVGQEQWEEMTRITRGANAQWGYREGSIAGPQAKPAQILGFDQAPLLTYPHTAGGGCVIGGMRYRGAKWSADLGGKLIYGDIVQRKVWTATLSETGAPPVIGTLLDPFSVGVVGLVNFATDSAGEIYLVAMDYAATPASTIYKLAATSLGSEPPALLSQTGVFTNLSTLATAPGIIPYDVANPLWSDAAAKQRWIILPNDGTHNSPAEDIAFSESGNWVFPAGTVFVKHFEAPIDERFPALTRRLETRFLVCTAGGGKYGLTYKWNAGGTDATLMTSGLSEDFDFTLADGTVTTRNWDFPSRGDCMRCHNDASGQALGFRTHQLNRGFTYPSTGRKDNQLATLNALGMFDVTLTAQQIGDFLASRPLNDETAPLEHRVRSYLDSNCSHCHLPGGPIPYFDARLTTPLAGQGIMDTSIQGRFDFPADGRYLKPGNAALSAIHHRLANVNNGAAMPPLAKNLNDDAAVAKLAAYINGLNPAEFAVTPDIRARYLRLTTLSAADGVEWASLAELGVLDGSGAEIPRQDLSILQVSSEETVGEDARATFAIDGDPNTFWHTRWSSGNLAHPHFITLDLGSIRSVGGFVYVPRQSQDSGRIAGYQVHHSADGVNWALLTSGTWPNSAATQRYEGAIGKRPARCQIAGPRRNPGAPFEVTVTFDMNVTGFATNDLLVSGGSVTSLRGKGHYYIASVTPAAATLTIQVAANAVSPQGLGSLASTTLTLATPTPYEAWADLYQIDPSPAGYSADDDHDGVPAILEFAFNLNPGSADSKPTDPLLNPSSGLPRMFMDTGAAPATPRFFLQYPRRRNMPGLSYVPQFGASLASGDFSPATATPTVQQINDDWESVTVGDQDGIGNPARFGRVKVVLEP